MVTSWGKTVFTQITLSFLRCCLRHKNSAPMLQVSGLPPEVASSRMGPDLKQMGTTHMPSLLLQMTDLRSWFLSLIRDHQVQSSPSIVLTWFLSPIQDHQLQSSPSPVLTWFLSPIGDHQVQSSPSPVLTWFLSPIQDHQVQSSPSPVLTWFLSPIRDHQVQCSHGACCPSGITKSNPQMVPVAHPESPSTVLTKYSPQQVQSSHSSCCPSGITKHAKHS